MTQDEQKIYSAVRQAGCSAAEASHVLTMRRKKEGTARIYQYVYSRLSKVWSPAYCHRKAALVLDEIQLANQL